MPEAGDHGGVDALVLLDGVHRLGKSPHVAGIDEAAGLAGLPEQEEGEPLVAAVRLHHDEPGALGSAEGAERGDAGRAVAKPPRGPARLDTSVEPILRNVHSTDDLVTVTCLARAIGGDQVTVRSYVTVASIPGPPTVVAGRGTGDIARSSGSESPSNLKASVAFIAQNRPCEIQGESRVGGRGRCHYAPNSRFTRPRRVCTCGFGEVDAEAIAAALVAAGHFGGGMPEWLDVGFVDFGRGGEAGPEGMAGEGQCPLALDERRAGPR